MKCNGMAKTKSTWDVAKVGTIGMSPEGSSVDYQPGKRGKNAQKQR